MERLLESWDRNCRMMTSLVGLVTPELSLAKPSEDGWTLQFHLAHLHEVRQGWLRDVSPEHGDPLADSMSWDREKGDFVFVADVETSRLLLQESGRAVREALIAKWDQGPVGPYSDVAQFVEHMIWHEGWHAGLIVLALRLAGAEPSEEWEEENVWAVWRS